MDWPKLVQLLLSPMVIHWVIGVMTTALVSLVTWNVKIGFKVAKDKLESAEAKLNSIEATTKVQAENHLKTIQDESLKQTAILERIEKQGVSTAAKFDTLIAVMGKS